MTCTLKDGGSGSYKVHPQKFYALTKDYGIIHLVSWTFLAVDHTSTLELTDRCQFQNKTWKIYPTVKSVSHFSLHYEKHIVCLLNL